MPAIPGLLNLPLIDVVGWTLLHFVWQGAVVAVLTGLLLISLRRASSHVRYLVQCGLFGLLAICPVFTGIWLVQQQTRPAGSPQVQFDSHHDSNAAIAKSHELQVLAMDDTSANPNSVAASGIAAEQYATISGRQLKLWLRVSNSIAPWMPWLVLGWGLGVALLSARLLVGWRVIQRLKRLAYSPASEVWQTRMISLATRLRVSRPVRLMETTVVEIPTVIGWLQPVILFPASIIMGLAPTQLEAVLAHELAHVRRHDYLVNLVQSAIEVLLFYHPTVWWLSACIRQERENCCDDIAVALCGDRTSYARALATMDEMRISPALTVALDGGSLLHRIRRIVLQTPGDVRTSTRWGASVIVLAALSVLAAAFGLAIRGDTNALAGDDKKPEQASALTSEWGPESNGIRCRVMPVMATSDDENPSSAKPVEQFDGSDSVTFAVELKNVSEKPITLLGVRYGNSYPAVSGKLNADFFAPYVFDFQFTDDQGKPISRTPRDLQERFMVQSGMSAHEVAPGKTLLVLLRPARFTTPLNYHMSSGRYRLKVRYHGPTEATRAEIKKHWPDYPQGNAWAHDVLSNEVTFKIGDSSASAMPDPLVWGAARDGLQAAMKITVAPPIPGAQSVKGSPYSAPGIPLNSRMNVVFHIKNVSDKVITFASESARQGDHAVVKDENGKELHLHSPFFRGLPIMVRWTLKPGEIADLQVLAPAINQISQPGKYTVQYTIRFDSLKSANFPLKDDWQSELVTGVTPLFLRERTAEDDARERPPTFMGRIEFTGKNGEPVETGVCTISGVFKKGELKDLPLNKGKIEVPDCYDHPLHVSVRASGFEEAYFGDVMPKPTETHRLQLVPSAQTQFRLISSDDNSPIAGAKVRFFNKTSGLASSGPIPMHGFEGPIWGTSGNDGKVVLDTLQRIDPYYDKLGDSVYHFCIEFPAAENGDRVSPPRIIGPIKAGQDLGSIRIGPPLEVNGEIHATPEELKRFAAEWDQPFELKTDNPDAAWDYAVSRKLETQTDGTKLTFRLTGLTSGRLRIVSNFGPHPHSVSHTYWRRNPGETDVVVDVELKESIGKLIITPKGRKVEESDD